MEKTLTRHQIDMKLDSNRASKSGMVQRNLALLITTLRSIHSQHGLPSRTGSRQVIEYHSETQITCKLCSTKTETRSHLLCECSFSEEVWRNLTQKLLALHYTREWDEISCLLNDQTGNNVQRFLLSYVTWLSSA